MQVSTVLGVAIPEEREQSSWTEGVAIWVAVVVVSLVGRSPHLPQCLLIYRSMYAHLTYVMFLLPARKQTGVPGGPLLFRVSLS